MPGDGGEGKGGGGAESRLCGKCFFPVFLGL